MKSEVLLGVSKTRLKLDPRTKILLSLSVNVVLISGGITGIDMIARIILAGIPALLLLIEQKYKAGLSYIIVFLAAALCEGIILHETSGILNLILLVASGLISRFLPCLIMGYYLVSTTTVSEFVAAMERMHVTQKIIIPMSVMFRFFPTIAEEMSAINTAMKMRGIGFGGTRRNPISILEYKIVPLMISVAKIGEELSAASLTKGMGGNCSRTNIGNIGFHIWDLLLIIIGLAGLIFCIIF